MKPLKEIPKLCRKCRILKFEDYPLAVSLCPLHRNADKLLKALKESHAEEMKNDHFSDGPTGCSYCAIIAKAEAK